MKIQSFEKGKTIIFICVNLSFILIIGLIFIQPFLSYIPDYGDPLVYISMAESGGFSSIKPFRYRILTPYLVYLLSFLNINTVTGFAVINLSSLFLTLYVLDDFLKLNQISFSYRLLGLSLFLYNPIIIFLLVNVCMVDMLFYFFFILGIYSIYTNKAILYSISLLIGVINKESILLLVVVFFFYHLRFKKKKLLKAGFKTGIYSLPGILLFILIRIAFQDSGLEYFSFESIRNIIMMHFENFEINPLFPLFKFYLPFGFLWIIAFYNFFKTEKEILKNLAWIVPFGFAQVILALSYDRLLFILFPLIFGLSINFFVNNDEGSIKFRAFISFCSILCLIAHFIGILLYMNDIVFFNPISAIFYKIFSSSFDLIVAGFLSYRFGLSIIKKHNNFSDII